MRCRLLLVLLLCTSAASGPVVAQSGGQGGVQGGGQSAGAPTPAERTGEQIYSAACVSCHGPDGKGQKQALLGFEPPDSFPDFTDCAVASAEPDAIWNAVIHRGGRIRGLSHIMPAFEDALTDPEIDRLVQFLHSFCAEPRWPRGNLNFPKAFFTEKAFPENEVVLSVGVVPSHPREFELNAVYERRIGRRGQIEISGPFTMRAASASASASDGTRPSSGWSKGIGDASAGFKYALFDSYRRGSIVSAGGEVIVPTGKQAQGLGSGVTVFEGFAMYGQALPRDAFFQVHAGMERPTDTTIEPNSTFWRTAVGKTFTPRRFGRIWTPMVEVLGSRALVNGATTEWDVVPQMQISLNVFQHIRFSVGARLPATERTTRSKSLMAYILWDFADGGLFDLWRAD
jgi:mono/diheme cytochrome c family protein